ncbi:MAG: hypothetical protein WBZ11_06475, partial [Candidatus Sulfotelmatobacter sp.]
MWTSPETTSTICVQLHEQKKRHVCTDAGRAGPELWSAPAGVVKTGSQCNAEYAANKAAIKNETIPQGAATAPPAAVPPQSVPMATA